MAGNYHADNQYRDSFIYDDMEAARSDVDMWLIELIDNRGFSMKEYYVKKDSGIRLTLKITPILSKTVTIWLERIEPVNGRVKAILTDGGSSD